MSEPQGSDSKPDAWLQELARAPAEIPPNLPSSGDRIGRFLLGRRLGSGGTGIVFEAVDEALARVVAIKFVLHQEAEATRRVLREAQLLAQLNHPGIAIVYDVLGPPLPPGIVLERVQGSTLRAVMRPGARLDERTAARWVAEAARAVAAAHRVGIVHRDLKPENAMVTIDGRVKLLDFGFAHAGSQRHDRAGTTGYIAPEAMRGEATYASDQYALGVVLIEMIAGRREGAFDELSRPLRAIAQRMVADKPEDRFADADDAALALERFADRSDRSRSGYFLRIGLAVSALASLALPVEPAKHAEVIRTPARRGGVQVVCPPLATDDPQDGWLGAAAASLLCKHAKALIGDGAIVVAPAELLALPHGPAADYPVDPFSQPNAREIANEAALALINAVPSSVLLSGAVRQDDAGQFVITALLMRDNRLPVFVTVERSGIALATQNAVRSLAVSDPRFAVLPATREQAQRLDLSFARGAWHTGGDLSLALERLRPYVDTSAEVAWLSYRLAKHMGIDAPARSPGLDWTSTKSLVASAPAHVLLEGQSAADIDRRLDVIEDSMEQDSLRPALLRARSIVALVLGDRERAGAYAHDAALEHPGEAPWSVLTHASYGRPEWPGVARATLAWLPEDADTWNILALIDSEGPERLERLERAYQLGDRFPLYAGNYAQTLLAQGRTDDARAIVAKLASGNAAQKSAAERLWVDLALADRQLEGAFDRSKSALERLSSVGSIESGDVAVMANAVELGRLLHRIDEITKIVVDRFVLADPPRLDRGAFSRQAVAHVCAYAPLSRARVCFDQLARLLRDGYFVAPPLADTEAYVAGARAFALRDFARAAAEFRRVRGNLRIQSSVAGVAFERVGDFDSAERVDPERPGFFDGMSLSHVRSAQRSFLRGRCEAGRTLLQRLRVALASADVVPAEFAQLERLRALCSEGIPALPPRV